MPEFKFDVAKERIKNATKKHGDYTKVRKDDHVTYGSFAEFANVQCVYGIKCKTTDRTYIGSTTNLQHRISKHFSELYFNRHRNWDLNNDFQKYGYDDFEVQILEVVSDKKDLADKEREWQIKYGIDKLYNLKISHTYIDERLRQMHVNSDKSSHKTNEYREKMSALKSNKIIQYAYDGFKEEWIPYRLYDNIKEVIIYNPTFKAQPIRGVCNGSKNTAYGYKWKYADNDGNPVNSGYKQCK